MAQPKTIDELARELALELHGHIYGDGGGGHIENVGISLIKSSLQSYGDQCAREMRNLVIKNSHWTEETINIHLPLPSDNISSESKEK